MKSFGNRVFAFSDFRLLFGKNLRLKRIRENGDLFPKLFRKNHGFSKTKHGSRDLPQTFRKSPSPENANTLITVEDFS